MLLMVHGKCCAGYHVYASVWRGAWCAGDQSIQQEQLRLCRRIRRAVLPFAESPWQHTCEVWVSGLGSPQENWDVHGGWLHPNFPRFRRSLVNFGTQIWGVQSSNIGCKSSQTVVHTAKDNSTIHDQIWSTDRLSRWAFALPNANPKAWQTWKPILQETRNNMTNFRLQNVARRSVARRNDLRLRTLYFNWIYKSSSVPPTSTEGLCVVQDRRSARNFDAKRLQVVRFEALRHMKAY